MSMFWIGYAAGFVTFPVVFGLLALGFLLLVPHWPNPTCGLSCIPCHETLIEDDSTRTVSGFIAELKYVIHGLTRRHRINHKAWMKAGNRIWGGSRWHDGLPDLRPVAGCARPA